MDKPLQATSSKIHRCGWCSDDPLYQHYHDTEWGVPQHDERHLFEMLILEGAQAGLSWITVLRKRAAYKEAFDDFDAERVARYTPARIEALLQNPGIVRNHLKLNAAVTNAQAALKLREQHGGLDPFFWNFVGGKPIRNAWAHYKDAPAATPASDAMSAALKKAGMKFVGSTICYAFMQANGMVMDHEVGCHCYAKLAKAAKR